MVETEHFRIAVFALMASLLLVASGLITHPYVAHDDWDWLIDWSQIAGFGTPMSKTLTEGRWLGAAWHLIAENLEPTTTKLLYLSGFVAFCAGFARLVIGRFTILGAFALVGAIPVALWSPWAATSTPPMLIAAVSVWLLNMDLSEARRLAVVFMATVLATMTYPGVGLAVLLSFVVSSNDGRLAALVKPVVAFLLAYVVALLIIHTLNLIEHGMFAVQPDGWRNPTPARSLQGLLDNIPRSLTALCELWALAAWPVVFGIACWPVAFFTERRQKLINAGAVAALALSMDTALGMVVGIDTSVRSYVWIWPALCVGPIMLLVSSSAVFRVTGTVALFVIAVCGLSYWQTMAATQMAAAQAEDAVGFEINRAMARNGTTEAILVGDIRRVPEFKGYIRNLQIQLALWKKFGIHLRECEPEECQDINRATVDHLETWQGQTVVRF